MHVYKNIESAICDLSDGERLWNLFSMESLRINLRSAALKNPNLADADRLIGVLKNNPIHRLRLAAASNPNMLNRQDVLLDIAKNDPHFYVRMEVCNFIKDDRALEDIVKSDSDSRVCQNAYRNICDVKILEDIAFETSNPTIQEIAASRVNNPQCLLHLAKNGFSSQASSKAFCRLVEEFPHLILMPPQIKDITDEDTLLDILENEWYWETRIRACSMIHDEEKLMEIILDYSNRQRDSGYYSDKNRFYDDIIKTAFKNITPEKFVIDAAKTGSYPIYSEALDKLEVMNPNLTLSYDDIEEHNTSALVYIAKNAINHLDRIHAVTRIDDEEVLCDVVKTDLCTMVRECSLDKITDENTLEYVVRNDLNPEVRKKAAEKIRSAEILTGIIHGCSDDDIITIAIDNINDEDILLGLAEDKRNSDYVRTKVVQSISNQETLKNIAKGFSEPWLIQQAIYNIHDVKFKLQIAKQHPCLNVEIFDFDKVDDEADIADAIWESCDWNYVGRALKYIDDESVLENLARNSPSDTVRQRTLMKMNHGVNSLSFLMAEPSGENDLLFLEIALNDSSHDVRCEAMAGIADESILLDLAFNSQSHEVRQMATGCISDFSSLLEVYKSDSSDDVRFSAVENSHFTNQEILIDIAKNDAYLPIVLTALEKIRDFSIVEEICRNSGDELLNAFSKDVEEYRFPKLGGILF